MVNKSTSTKSRKKKTTTESKVDMNKVQSKVCRDILDAAEVTKSQVSNTIIENLSKNGSSKEEMKLVIASVSSQIDTQANQLLDRVIKNLS